MNESTTIRVKGKTYYDLKDLKNELFGTETASFDAVVSELIDQHDDN